MAAGGTQSAFVPGGQREFAGVSGGLLRFTTAGSVDDGKSTLIGRLLHDSRAVYEDQLASVRNSGINRSPADFDLALLTDGLRAEREQGITIDVAYRYFTTARRKFIIADTPGHEQYTRNMATGASTAHAAIILIDATKGVLSQSRRHAYIASLLGVQHLIAAINKMDMVDYSEEVFRKVSEEFRGLAGQLGAAKVYQVPISALKGDNVVHASVAMPWFDGPPLLEYLENLALEEDDKVSGVRFPVQYVSRPDAGFRGFAGELRAGVLRPGMPLTALPSGASVHVKSIVSYEGELQKSSPGDAITVTLDREIDLSRGDMLVSGVRPSVSEKFRAKLVWMDSEKLDPSRFYLLKHTSRVVRARVGVRNRVNIDTFSEIPAETLGMNDIGEVEIETTLPVFVDDYRQNRATGSFILIDPISNATVAAGMVDGARVEAQHAPAQTTAARVKTEERSRRVGHPAIVVWMKGRFEAAELLERNLFAQRWNVQLIGPGEYPAGDLPVIAKVLHAAGSVAIFSTGDSEDAARAVQAAIPAGAYLEVPQSPGTDHDRVAGVIERLTNWSADSDEGGR